MQIKNLKRKQKQILTLIIAQLILNHAKTDANKLFFQETLDICWKWYFNNSSVIHDEIDDRINGDVRTTTERLLYIDDQVDCTYYVINDCIFYMDTMIYIYEFTVFEDFNEEEIENLTVEDLGEILPELQVIDDNYFQGTLDFIKEKNVLNNRDLFNVENYVLNNSEEIENLHNKEDIFISFANFINRK